MDVFGCFRVACKDIHRKTEILFQHLRITLIFYELDFSSVHKISPHKFVGIANELCFTVLKAAFT